MNRRRDDRGPWYLFTGLVLGIIGGLVYAWLISPVTYVDTEPSSLRGDFKDQYRVLIALAYLSNSDLERARARLALLQDPDAEGALSLQSQVALEQGRPASEVSALNALALALIQGPITPAPTTPVPSATATRQVTPSPTPTSVVALATEPTASATVRSGTAVTRTPTITPLPTRTATPTPGGDFILIEQALVCTPGTASLIQVEVRDAASQPVPGIELIVNWDGGEDHFFTGLKPELGAGYADFSILPDVTYRLRLADGGEPLPDLIAVECEADDGSRFWGSWKLVFQQP